MKTLLFLAFILCTASVGFAIKCKICTSPTSMEDCKKNEKEQDCGGSSDRCSTLSLDYKALGIETKLFAKACATRALCDSSQQFNECKKIEGAKCEFNCCDSDGCNSSAMPMISAFLMILCALVSMCY